MAADNRIESYRGKLILAPMVRIGTLPMRLLALDYGADIVYCEEIIDFKILQCKRVENRILDTIDYVWTDGSIIFRTCSKERGKVVFQMGTADAQRALKAAKMIEDDVAAIDINMGCPKSFSVTGGMGAALLTQPDKIKEILTTLVQNIKKPVTCKIRILPELADTLDLVKLIEATGVAALGVHGRTKEERPRHSNHNDVIKKISETVKIPILANGGSRGIKVYEDISKFLEATGASSAMLARAPMWNASVFRPEGMLPLVNVIKDYLRHAVHYESITSNLKYTLQNMMHECLETPEGKALLSAATVRDVCVIWDLEEYRQTVLQSQREKAESLKLTDKGPQKRRLDDGSEIVEMFVRYERKEYPNTMSPKQILHEWAKKHDKSKPIYTTQQNSEDRLFYTIVEVDGKKFASVHWDKKKKHSEQAAAVVCLTMHGVDTRNKLSDSQPVQATNHSDQNNTNKKDNIVTEDNGINHRPSKQMKIEKENLS